MPHILLLGTCDTKLEELLYTRNQLVNQPGVQVTLIDAGRYPTDNPAITVSQSELTTQFAPDGAPSDISSLDRGKLNKHMAACATNYVRSLVQKQPGQKQPPGTSSVHGILALGGSGGTTLAAAAMRDACPPGFPKLIVSTIASGDTGSIVGETDLTLMYSVVDVAGLNALLRNVLSNATGAMLGMASSYERFLRDEHRQQSRTHAPGTEGKSKKKLVRVGLTMFGVTTPCVDAARARLARLSGDAGCAFSFEPYVFHATGHGGKAMERLVAAGALDAVLDLTTTEVCDHLCGGNMSAGAARLDAAARQGLPQIVSLGATDMVNFGPKDSAVPERYRDRKLFVHNPSVTLMRTSPAECAEVGRFVAEKLRKRSGNGRVQVWLPKGGVSVMSEKGGPFEDAGADEALFRAVREGLEGSDVKVVEDERPINDEGFARDVVDALVGMLE